MFRLFEAINRELLGKYGRALLDFFLSNSYIICPIVVFYGFFLVMAQRNMEQIRKKVKTLENNAVSYEKNPDTALEEKKPEFWEELRKASRFPFISLPSSFALYPITQANLNKLLIKFESPKYNRPFGK